MTGSKKGDRVGIHEAAHREEGNRSVLTDYQTHILFYNKERQMRGDASSLDLREWCVLDEKHYQPCKDGNTKLTYSG